MKDKIQTLRNEVRRAKDSRLFVEKDTRKRLINSFFLLMGYDTNSSQEFDKNIKIKIKKGFFQTSKDVIDFAVIANNEPLMLIILRGYRGKATEDLTYLKRYFQHVGVAKYGLITDGDKYSFYKPFSRTKEIQSKPFYQLQITSLTDRDYKFLEQLQKEQFIETTQLKPPKVEQIIRETKVDKSSPHFMYTVEIARDEVMESLAAIRVKYELKEEDKYHPLHKPIYETIDETSPTPKINENQAGYPLILDNGLTMLSDKEILSPSHFSLFDKKFKFETWEDTLATIAQEVINMNDEKFKVALTEQYKTKKQGYFSDYRQALTTAYEHTTPSVKVYKLADNFYHCSSLTTLQAYNECRSMLLRAITKRQKKLFFYYEKPPTEEG